MHNKQTDEQKSPLRRFLFIFGLLMFSLYFVLGVAIMWWKDFPLVLSANYRIAFGILLIVYSFVRFVRLLKR